MSVSVPAILASEHIEYLPYVETATAQIAMVVLLSTFMTPVFVKILDSKKA
ncbi:2-keto-3-deoxygluconate permease [Laedolimicola ammoniilytica]|uniref:2-keto-3-deoxygluconate permease n=1 Tax=Laedolimicola ammoniilytica TaxID=2981771 RepID=UPI003A8795EF